MKRSRPDADTVGVEETGLPGRPRVSEAHSTSTCDSDFMEVQRIHSGIPVLPDARKTDGMSWPPVAEHPGCHSGRPGRVEDRDDTHTQEGASGHTPRGFLRLREFDGRAKLTVQRPVPKSSPSASVQGFNQQVQQMLLGTNAGRPAPLAEGTSSAHGAQRPNTLVGISKQGLQQQLQFLEADEQDILTQLRTLRRDYDVRVSALSQPVVPAQRTPSGPPPAAQYPRLPLRHRLPMSSAPGAAAPPPPPPQPPQSVQGTFHPPAAAAPQRRSQPDGHGPQATAAGYQFARKSQGVSSLSLRRPFSPPAPSSAGAPQVGAVATGSPPTRAEGRLRRGAPV
jgi:hypothetical protein